MNMYLRVIPDFTSQTINSCQKIVKQALTKQTDLVEIKTNIAYINTLLQTFIQSMSIIGAFESIPISFTLPYS